MANCSRIWLAITAALGLGIACLVDTPPAHQACLDALRVTNGATHTEVMMTDDGPCLVEVNSRCHGLSGAWMPLVQALPFDRSWLAEWRTVLVLAELCLIIISCWAVSVQLT